MSLPKNNYNLNINNATNFQNNSYLNNNNLINNIPSNQTFIPNTYNQNNPQYKNNQNIINQNKNAQYLQPINVQINRNNIPPQPNQIINNTGIYPNNYVNNKQYISNQIGSSQPNYINNMNYNNQSNIRATMNYNIQGNKLRDFIYPKRSFVVPLNSNNYEYQSILKPKINKVDAALMENKLIKDINNNYKEMQQRQKILRNNVENIENTPPQIIIPKAIEKKENQKIKRVMEDVCIYGNVVKKEIKNEKQNNPEKYIPIETALNSEQNDPGLFALGILATDLQENGIETEILKDEPIINKEQNEEKENAAATCLQFMTNGLLYKKKYDFEFDLDDNRINEIIFNEEKFDEFKESIKNKLNKDFNIPKDIIIITFPQLGSLIVQIIIQSEEYNYLKTEDFLTKFRNDDNFPELKTLKKVHEGFLMCGCKLSRRQLDPLGNRFEWPQKPEFRGGEPYYPPQGWVGIGLKVFNQYENDRWIDMQNQEGEWVVAYHGLGRGMESNRLNKVMGDIYRMGFIPGGNQRHKDCDDFYHSGKKVGEGVYVTPYINIAEEYAGYAIINGKRYKIVIMVRINPKARRHCITCEESKNYKYWVVNATVDEIRPYRILYKRCD